MMTSRQHRTRRHAIDGSEPFPRYMGSGGGRGTTGTTTDIPPPLTPLILSAVGTAGSGYSVDLPGDHTSEPFTLAPHSGITGMMPDAQAFFRGMIDAGYTQPQNLYDGLNPGAQKSVMLPNGEWSQNLQARQIAPLNTTEKWLLDAANATKQYVQEYQPGFANANKALALNSADPLNALARTQVATPQGEVDFMNQNRQGLNLLNSTRNLPPTRATGEYYKTQSGLQGGIGQKVGATSQETSANSALNALTGAAGQRVSTPGAETQALSQLGNYLNQPISTPQAEQQTMTQMANYLNQPISTPQAETQALAQIGQLTGGALGSSPSTQQAIAALEHQYNTRALPSLQNQLSMAGLGRSGALEQGITDLRGQLFGAEVPLLQQEIANREQTIPYLQDIAKAQQGRQTGVSERLLQTMPFLQDVGRAQQGRQTSMSDRLLSTMPALQDIGKSQQGRSTNDIERVIQGLNSQATGFSSLGGQLAGRSETDLQRDAATQLGMGGQLQSQQGLEQAAQNAPIDRELGYLQNTQNPLLALSAQQQGRTQIPIDRQIQTALQESQAFMGVQQGEGELVKLLQSVGATERQRNQAINDASLDNNLRAQALAEAIMMGPLGIMPSLIGSKTTTTGGGK